MTKKSAHHDKSEPVEGHQRMLRDLWRDLYHSTRVKMSQGASNITKIITSAQKDQWRRKERKK